MTLVCPVCSAAHGPATLRFARMGSTKAQDQYSCRSCGCTATYHQYQEAAIKETINV